MGRSRIAITLDEALLSKVDQLVAALRFPSRSRAIEEAVAEKIARLERIRLSQESARLDPAFEHRLANEALGGDAETGPEY